MLQFQRTDLGYALVMVAVLMLSGGCSILPTNHGEAPPHAKAASHDIQWSYDGRLGAGPQSWAQVAPDAAGLEQSPVALPAGPLGDTELPVAYGHHLVSNVQNNGHTWQVNFADTGGQLTLDDKAYHLLQFHFHTPSEHTIRGASDATIVMTHASGLVSDRHHPMEMHLVHKSDDGQLAVIGVFIKAGKTNTVLANAWSKLTNLPPGRHKAMRGHALDAAALLPPNKAYQWYSGSLTTPPCSQNVRWVVLTEPIELSQSQIDSFVTGMHAAGNPYTNRPVQALNDRQVTAVSGQHTAQAPPLGRESTTVAHVETKNH